MWLAVIDDIIKLFMNFLQMQASELVELGLSKLEFLEVTKKGLSKLQILLVELEVKLTSIIVK